MGGTHSQNMDIEHDPGLAAVLQYLIRRLVQCYLIGETFNIIRGSFLRTCVYVCPLIEGDRKAREILRERENKRMTERQREKESERMNEREQEEF